MKVDNLNYLLTSEHVYRQIPYIEYEFCSGELGSIYAVVNLYAYLFVVILVLAFSLERLKFLAEKKRSELEVIYLY